MDKLLMMLDKNARMPVPQLATAAGMSEAEVEKQLADYEKKGILQGYKTLIDWDRTDRNYVTARIEVKVMLDKTMGFDDVAQLLASFEEVETVYLVSGHTTSR
jgi:DNA-binding Lrp family transcriptional regulator